MCSHCQHMLPRHKRSASCMRMSQRLGAAQHHKNPLHQAKPQPHCWLNSHSYATSILRETNVMTNSDGTWSSQVHCLGVWQAITNTVNCSSCCNCGSRQFSTAAAATHRKGCCGSFHTGRAPTSTSSSDAFLSAITFLTAGPQRTQSGHHDTPPVAGSGSAMNST
jgi:hypothetical protein